MTRTICLIRHGATAYNLRRIFMGTLDIPLGRAGAEQAMALREALAGRRFDAVYCSPLLRAVQTTMISLGVATPRFMGEDGYELTHHPPTGEAPPPVMVDPRLMERSFGDLQGEPREGYQQRHRKYEGRQVTISFHDRADGGESFADLQRRIEPFVDAVRRLESAQAIAVFAHNGPLRVIERLLLGLSEEETLRRRFDNGSFREHSL